MGRGLWRVAVLVLLGAELAGCQQAARLPAPVAYEREPWAFRGKEGTRLTTAHYDIYTTLQDRVLIEALPDFVEAAYASYERMIPPQEKPTRRMPVFLFAGRGDWEAFTRKFTGERAKSFLQIRNGGYSERGVSVIQYVQHAVTFPLFAHEGFHQYLHHHVNTRIPSWLNEGLAVASEGQRWVSERGRYGVQAFDPWYNPARRNVLAQAVIADRLLPLRHLLETHPGEVLNEGPRAVQTYYAQVWALALFLGEGADGKYAQSFRTLLDELGEVDVMKYARAAHIWSERGTFNFGEALFRSYISEDLDTVESEYRAFLHARFIGPN
jgi:hypothetical protein